MCLCVENVESASVEMTGTWSIHVDLGRLRSLDESFHTAGLCVAGQSL